MSVAMVFTGKKLQESICNLFSVKTRESNEYVYMFIYSKQISRGITKKCKTFVYRERQ